MRVKSNIFGRKYFHTVFLGDKDNNKSNEDRVSEKAYQGHSTRIDTFRESENKQGMIDDYKDFIFNIKGQC